MGVLRLLERWKLRVVVLVVVVAVVISAPVMSVLGLGLMLRLLFMSTLLHMLIALAGIAVGRLLVLFSSRARYRWSAGRWAHLALDIATLSVDRAILRTGVRSLLVRGLQWWWCVVLLSVAVVCLCSWRVSRHALHAASGRGCGWSSRH